MKKIGLVGYYGFGNYGDELFHELFIDYFHDHTVLTLSDVVGVRKSFQATPSQRLEFANEVEAIIIGGGDLIRPGDSVVNHWFEEYLTKPVAIVGVGVASWAGFNDHVVGQIKQFLCHPSVKYIGVRDERSLQWIREHINPTCPLEFHFDLVCAMDFPVSLPSAEKTMGIISWNQGGDDKKKKRTQLVLNKIHARGRELGYKTVLINPSFADLYEADQEHIESLGLDDAVIVSPKTTHGVTDALSRCDLVVSAKFHGCIAAVMMGKPAISLSKIDKFRNFYQQLEREDLLCGIYDESPLKAFRHIEVSIPSYFIEMAKKSSKQAIKSAYERLTV